MIYSIIIFAISMCITPGPNNIMLTSSGANFGYKRTFPHILGIELGMLILFLLSAFGLGFLFKQIPIFQTILKILGSCYLLYLAWRVAFSKRANSSVKNTKPLNIFQAAAFQLLNPKAYIITITGMSTFTKSGIEYASSALLIIMIFAIICMPSISVWAGFGTLIGKFLKDDKAFRVFNIVMGALIALSVIFILL